MGNQDQQKMPQQMLHMMQPGQQNMYDARGKLPHANIPNN